MKIWHCGKTPRGLRFGVQGTLRQILLLSKRLIRIFANTIDKSFIRIIINVIDRRFIRVVTNNVDKRLEELLTLLTGNSIAGPRKRGQTYKAERGPL